MEHTSGERVDHTGRRTYEVTESDRIGDAVVEAVADATGQSPRGMDPLFETVDPDAIDGLFGASSGDRVDDDVRLAFGYEGCEVVVGSERLCVRPPTRE